MAPRPRPELLAPAGDWDALRAAVANGADAVYFGLSRFNARHRAANFTPERLPEVLDFLHRRNVRGFVTLNTLIFSDELPAIAEYVKEVAAAGADAVIVQDLGLARLIKRLVPGLPVHGSTQMTLTEPRGIEFARRKLGVERVVLARELSLEDIRKVAGQTVMPLEVFVHGALCVAYSGQCLTSEALGGRSANRGQCAQACRLPYEMIVDGHPRDLGDRAYLLSPQDLAAYELVAPLAEAGVVSFKIEGRLKGPHYVAATTQTYRAAIDAAAEGQGFTLDPQGQRDLAQTFSRGFTPGFLEGPNHQRLVQGRFPKSRGVKVGVVVGTTKRGVLVEPADPVAENLVKPGDGVVFDQGRPEEQEPGGRVWEVRSTSIADLGLRIADWKRNSKSPKRRRGRSSNPQSEIPNPQLLELLFEPGALDLRSVAAGNVIWKTDDPALRRRLEQSYAGDRPAKRVPVTFRVAGRVGGALEVVCRDAEGNAVSASWPGPLEAALKHPLTAEGLREQLGRLGDTPFELAGVEAELPDPVIVPRSVLNDLRRQAAALLERKRAEATRYAVAEPDALERLRAEAAALRKGEAIPPAGESRLTVLVRNFEQLDAVLAWKPEAPLLRPAMVYCDFEDARRYREAVERARAAGMPVGLATLRILKPGEEGFLAPVARAGADAILVRNLAGLSYFREETDAALVGDFSLNVANEITAGLFIEEGLTRLVPSYDLNWEQIVGLVERSDPAWFEPVVHQHMAMFHMEHCVFAAFLSSGKDWRDCGRPCDRHKVELRDRVGAEFPVAADAGCRNTVFNSVPQSAAEYLPRLKSLGVRHFRVELLRESTEETEALLNRYARVLAGLEDGRSAWRGLQVLNQLGVTRGTMA